MTFDGPDRRSEPSSAQGPLGIERLWTAIVPSPGAFVCSIVHTALDHGFPGLIFRTGCAKLYSRPFGGRSTGTCPHMGLDETARVAVREQAEATLNSIGDAVLSTDLDGRVVYLNSAA